MGGDKNRQEPSTCEKRKKNKFFWQEVVDGALIPFLDRLHGPFPLIMEAFVNGWKKGSLRAYGADYQINETLVATVTSLATIGRMFYKDRKIGEETCRASLTKTRSTPESPRWLTLTTIENT